MKALRWTVPLLIFAVLIAFLWVGLGRDPREVPSPLIGKACAVVRAGAPARRRCAAVQ